MSDYIVVEPDAEECGCWVATIPGTDIRAYGPTQEGAVKRAVEDQAAAERKADDLTLRFGIEAPDLDAAIAKLRESNDLADALKAKLAALAVPVVSVPSMWTYPWPAGETPRGWVTYTATNGSTDGKS